MTVDSTKRTPLPTGRGVTAHTTALDTDVASQNVTRHPRRESRRPPRRPSSLASGHIQAALSTLVAVALVACGGAEPQVVDEVEALRTEVSLLREELAAQTTLT